MQWKAIFILVIFCTAGYGIHVGLKGFLPKVARDIVGQQVAASGGVVVSTAEDPANAPVAADAASQPLPQFSKEKPVLSDLERELAQRKKITVYSLPVPHVEMAATRCIRLLGAEPTLVNVANLSELEEQIYSRKLSIGGKTLDKEALNGIILPLFCAGRSCYSKEQFYALARSRLSPGKLAERRGPYAVVYASEGSQAAKQFISRLEAVGISPEFRDTADEDHLARSTMLMGIYEVMAYPEYAVEVNGRLFVNAGLEQVRKEYGRKAKTKSRHVPGEIILE